MHAYGAGIATIAARHEAVIEVWYPHFGLDESVLAPIELEESEDPRRHVRFEVVRTSIELSSPPRDAADGYLRLHLLSGRVIAPHGLSVEGMFGVLPLVAWTDLGAIHPADLDEVRLHRRLRGRSLVVHGIDKFPRMTDLVSPPGIRVADASRVRLGAHLAEGTVVMHEGFINFNAGTLGSAMIEGRVTQGSVVEADTDIGAGSSIMGTLSGGGTNILRIGKRCLLGANGGTGISLGDDSAVEAGLYVTKGTLVTLPDGRVVKAAELSGTPGILFRRHSVKGNVEAVPWKSSTFKGLNTELHHP
jgi:2,3,4,5-tetrahydropyridine-2,6-dicarboxylate N-succinyltransferase